MWTPSSMACSVPPLSDQMALVSRQWLETMGSQSPDLLKRLLGDMQMQGRKFVCYDASLPSYASPSVVNPSRTVNRQPRPQPYGPSPSARRRHVNRSVPGATSGEKTQPMTTAPSLQKSEAEPSTSSTNAAAGSELAMLMRKHCGNPPNAPGSFSTIFQAIVARASVSEWSRNKAKSPEVESRAKPVGTVLNIHGPVRKPLGSGPNDQTTISVEKPKSPEQPKISFEALSSMEKLEWLIETRLRRVD